MASAVSELVSPYSFVKALEAAGLVEDQGRIAEVVIRAVPGKPVLIEVTYLADQRIFKLTETDDRG